MVPCLSPIGSFSLTGLTLHCTALHYTALHCTALHYNAMQCTTLHSTAERGQRLTKRRGDLFYVICKHDHNCTSPPSILSPVVNIFFFYNKLDCKLHYKKMFCNFSELILAKYWLALQWTLLPSSTLCWNLFRLASVPQALRICLELSSEAIYFWLHQF